jgi:hypothetical protein
VRPDGTVKARAYIVFATDPSWACASKHFAHSAGADVIS